MKVAGKWQGYFSTKLSSKPRIWSLSFWRDNCLWKLFTPSYTGLWAASWTKSIESPAPSKKWETSKQLWKPRDDPSSLDSRGLLFGQSNMQEKLRLNEQFCNSFFCCRTSKPADQLNSASFGFCCLAQEACNSTDRKRRYILHLPASPALLGFFP